MLEINKTMSELPSNTGLYIKKVYIIFALHGETAIILGFCNPIIFEYKRLVAVAGNTNNVLLQELCSPILDRVERNVVPLKLYKWIILEYISV